MSTESFLVQATVYLAAAVVAVPLAKRFGFGSVLGYLLAGVVIGPFGLHLVGAEGQDVMHFAEFGVVMMLFVIGLELEPARLWRLRGPILGLGGLEVLLTTGIFTAGGMALGLGWPAALAVGMTLSLSSTAIVLQTLAEKGLLRTAGGRSVFSVLLFQDMAVIPMLAVIPLLATVSGAAHGPEPGAQAGHDAATWIAGLPPLVETAVVLAAVATVVFGGRFLMRPAFRAVAGARMREIFTAAALLLVIGTALLMTRVGLSPALGTFLAGVVLADSEYRHELETDIEPFKGLLLGLFFIAVGASIDFGLIAAQPWTIVGLTVAIMAIKAGILGILARAFRLSFDQGLLLAFALPQMGEFAFVLFSFANQVGVLGTTVTSPLVAAVALSMAITPLLLVLNERVLQPRFGTLRAEKRETDAMPEERNPVLIVGFGAFGTTVGRLLNANGIHTTVLDWDSDRVDLLRRLGLEVYYGDATRHDLLRTAGAADARVLVVALDTPEKIQEVVALARKHFPNLKVVARAFDWFDAQELTMAGVDHVYRESLDSALRAGAETLRVLGFRAYQAHRSAQKFLELDETLVRMLAQHREEDRTSYLTRARHRLQELEDVLLADLNAPDVDRDRGWDPATLREEARGGRPARSEPEAG